MSERKTLWIVFGFNFLFFITEMTAGLISNSLGLVGDSLDMFADAMIYGLSLIALGKVRFYKKGIAFTQCAIQTIMLGLVGFEIVRRFIFETEMPNFWFMIIVSACAFAANSISYSLLKRLHSKDANIKASEICSRIDCLVNLGVIIGGVFVLVFNSKLPDLIVSSLIWIWAVKELTEMYKTASTGECGCSCCHKI